ncbi:intraflagellar transport protein 46 homolog [Tigriopus californicus]|uniref:intraflagellar transport protein 46 homolog n=1 Tax=Tigriopus californicus TaxID=6832 RepID=UPI0027DA50EF|nr:intraflagellar transport protein 46 homolog [Tigriopus californicus]
MSWLKKTSLFKKSKEEPEENEELKGENDQPETHPDDEAEENMNSETNPSTPEPRSGTAGSIRSRIQPPSFQPTLHEDSEHEEDVPQFGELSGSGELQERGLDEGPAHGELEPLQFEPNENPMGDLPPTMNDQSKEEDDSDDDSDDESDDDDDDDVAAPPLEGMYDPSEYENLNVSSDIKDLFQYILRYTPQTIDLDTKFKPFIPEYIPAVGDIDAFIKVLRPDDKKEDLGLRVLDEPAPKQSDPSVLELQLRAISKQSSHKAAQVKKIESGEKSSKDIEKWIKDISDLHRSKPPPTVHYSKPMPDIDFLMQEWPPEMEEMLKETGIPTAELDCDLATYVDISCGLLDIPVYKSRIQSLHVLFNLYSAFRNSQHFNQLAQDNNMDNALKDGLVDRVEF